MDTKRKLLLVILLTGLSLYVESSTSPDPTTQTTEKTESTTTAPSTTPTTPAPTATSTPIPITNGSSTPETSSEAPTTTEHSTPTPFPTHDGYQYLFKQENETTEINFESAEANCVSWGGHLVSIHDKDENAFVVSVIVNYNGTAWIGLQQMKTNYSWTDDSTFDFANNLSDEAPDSNDTHCFVIQNDGNWSNVSCEDKQLAYICKQPTVTTPAPSTTQAPNHPLNPAGLSHTELILIICAVVLVGVTFSLGAVWFIYKRKSRRRAAGAFSLLENEAAVDFRVDDGYMDN